MDINTILIVALLIAVGLIALYFLLSKPTGGAEWKIKATENLKHLKNEAVTNDPMRLKNALVDADKLLDFVLKNKKIKGETLGERLKNAEMYFSKENYNKIWRAHKARNSAVHEINYSAKNEVLKEDVRVLTSAVEKLISL